LVLSSNRLKNYNKNYKLVYNCNQVFIRRLDKIVMLSQNKMIPLLYLGGHNYYINEHVLKKLRAGDLSGTLTLITIGLAVYLMVHFSNVDPFVILRELGNFNAPTTVEGFNYPYNLKSSKPGFMVAKVHPPAAMPNEKFLSLTKEQKRQVPHPYDGKIEIEERPRLRVGYWQTRYKIPDHGHLHDLPYILKDNGEEKYVRNEKNTVEMIKSIEDMVHRPEVIWFDQADVTYQGQTAREFPAVYIYDQKTEIIAVFKKETGDFITTCQLTTIESKELYETHNFGGPKSCPTNRMNRRNPQEITLINSFENDIMGITPLDRSEPQIDNSNN
jgi:hypothetical protein